MSSRTGTGQRLNGSGMRVVVGGGALSIVLGGKTHERRPFWISLLASRAFSLRARMRDDDTKASASGDAPQQHPVASANKRYPAPTSGEDADFDAFFAQHERALYGYLRRMLLTHEAALDVAQEAFFRAWQRFETLRGYDRPQAWLFRVATNLAFDTLRRRQPMGLSRLFGQRAAATSSDSDASDAIPALTDPFDMERSLADRDLVNQALERIPERQRAAVLLWAAHGLTSAEIAAALDTTEVNARQLLARGRARFREIYELAQKSD